DCIARAVDRRSRETHRVRDTPATERGLAIVTAEECPDLWEQAEAAFLDVWPEYNLHDDVSGEYFGALVPRNSSSSSGTPPPRVPVPRERAAGGPARRHRRHGAARRARVRAADRAVGARRRSGPRPTGTRSEPDRDRRHGRPGRRRRIRRARRTRPAELEGPLSAHLHRAVRRLVARRRASVRPVVARARAHGR